MAYIYYTPFRLGNSVIQKTSTTKIFESHPTHELKQTKSLDPSFCYQQFISQTVNDETYIVEQMTKLKKEETEHVTQAAKA